LPETADALRLSDALASATAMLAGAGCETPRLDAELLLAASLGVGRERLVLDAAADLDGAVQETFDALVARRAAREPVAHILGRKAFRRITLAVDRRALVPRPETELLVEFGSSLPARARVADVGCGSGAVALALKDERPDLAVWATDIDGDALSLARENARRLALDVSFARADLLLGLDVGFDTVLANLPYVPRGEPLAAEIDLYEPPAALFGGRDGLGVVRRLVAMLAGVPLVALEVGAGQAAEVGALLHREGFGSVRRIRDLAGVERVLVGRR